jgi:hypothetical protein
MARRIGTSPARNAWNLQGNGGSNDRSGRDAGSAGDRHHPDALHGRGAEGQFGSPRRADGNGADGVHAVDALPAPRPRRSQLAEPRPLPALRRPRQHASLLAPLSHRLRPHDRGSAVVPTVGLAHARSPRARPHQGRRGDDRPARPGLRRRRRNGHRPAPPRRRVQQARPQADRPLRVRDLLRRRPAGGDHRRGRFAGGSSEAGQARLPL